MRKDIFQTPAKEILSDVSLVVAQLAMNTSRARMGVSVQMVFLDELIASRPSSMPGVIMPRDRKETPQMTISILEVLTKLTCEIVMFSLACGDTVSSV